MKRILTHLFLIVAFAGSAFAATPQLQLVHNAADPTLDSISIWIMDGGTVVDSNTSFKFRTATPIIPLPSGGNFSVIVGLANSTRLLSIDTFSLGSLADSNYVAFLNGVLVPASFAANPDGESTALNVYLLHQARFQSSDITKTDLAYFHGTPDAPTIDVRISSPAVATLVNDLGYGEFQTYSLVSPTTYIVKITDATGATVIKSFLAPLGTATGAAAVVFASGFVNPAANQNGKPFGIYAVTNIPGQGQVVFPLTAISTATVQLIHNAPDTSLASVDLYFTTNANQTLVRKFDNFDFRTAQAYLDMPAGVPLKVIVAPKNSIGIVDSLKTFDVTFAGDSVYVVIADGVLNVANYGANPDGVSTALNFFAHKGRVFGSNPNQADLILFQGIPDAPTIDVKTLAPQQTTLINDIQYGSYDSAGYLTLDTGSYIIQLTNADQTTVLKMYAAPLSLTVGKAAVVYTSGFLNPASNSSGPAYTVQVTLANAITLSLPEYVGINETPFVTGVKMFPNPANTNTRMSFNLEKASNVKMILTNMAGQQVQSADLGNLSIGTNNVDINVADLANGMYNMSLVIDNAKSFTRPVIVNK